MTAIAADTVTVWRRMPGGIDHALWERGTVGGCLVEGGRGSRASIPQAAVSDSATLYAFSDVPLSEGDMVAVGAPGPAEPPADALRVVSVERWAPCGAFHHLEARCR